MKKLFYASKRKKTMIAFSFASIAAVYFTAINAFAHYYDKFPAELFDHLIKRTWLKDLGRTIMWHILCCFGRIIDYFEKAVDAIVNFNMYNLFKRITGYSDLNPVIPMVFSIFMILGACAMMIFPNKIKVKDYLKGKTIFVVELLTVMTILASIFAIIWVSQWFTSQIPSIWGCSMCNYILNIAFQIAVLYMVIKHVSMRHKNTESKR